MKRVGMELTGQRYQDTKLWEIQNRARGIRNKWPEARNRVKRWRRQKGESNNVRTMLQSSSQIQNAQDFEIGEDLACEGRHKTLMCSCYVLKCTHTEKVSSDREVFACMWHQCNAKEQKINVVLLWLSLLVLMDIYRIKIQCDLTADENHNLRENIVQCLSRWAFRERTYRTTQTQKENNRLQHSSRKQETK